MFVLVQFEWVRVGRGTPSVHWGTVGKELELQGYTVGRRGTGWRTGDISWQGRDVTIPVPRSPGAPLFGGIRAGLGMRI